MRLEVSKQMNNLEKESNNIKSGISPKVNVSDNKVVNKKFQDLQNKCFDDIENVVFKLVYNSAYKLTGI